MIIKEVKRNINKDDEVYECRLLHREEGYLVLSYVSDRPGRIGKEIFERGSTTFAHYWTDRGYVLWEMHSPDGRLRGYNFHICKDVKIGEDYVEYLDLMLDLWFYPDGVSVEIDKDELEECKRKGMVDDEEMTWIESQRDLIVGNFACIVENTWKAENKVLE